jgi:hypothetical protein
MGCLEEAYTYAESSMGDPGMQFLSPKNQSECLAAGGTPTPYYNWITGTWYCDPPAMECVVRPNC